MVSELLAHSQAAPRELKKSTFLSNPSRLSFVSKSESAGEWLKYEQLIFSCSTTEDDVSALSCVKLLEQRFGAENEKVRSLRGVFEEAQASDLQADNILKLYEEELKANPANIPLAKRHITLLRNTGRGQEAILYLCKLVDLSPTDIEAWAELAELYATRSLFKQAIFCLEEVLLVQPNAWSIHAHLGELLLKQASISVVDKLSAAENIHEAFQHFCRSVELCEDYVRGYCGLKQSSSRLLRAQNETPEVFHNLSIVTVEKLRDLATDRLETIVRLYPTGQDTPPEILAAKLILES